MSEAVTVTDLLWAVGALLFLRDMPKTSKAFGFALLFVAAANNIIKALE